MYTSQTGLSIKGNNFLVGRRSNVASVSKSGRELTVLSDVCSKSIQSSPTHFTLPLAPPSHRS